MMKKKIPNTFIIILFFLAVVMIVLGFLREDSLFYIRAGIFGVGGLLIDLLNRKVKK